VRLFELPRIGGTATLTLSFVNGSHSMTRTIDGTELGLIDYAVGNAPADTNTIHMAVQNTSATWSCPTTFQGAAVACAYAFSDSDGSGSYSSGNSLTVTCGTAPSAYTREFGAMLKPVKSYSQVGRIQAMAQPYPDNVNVLVTDHAEYDPTLDTGTIFSGQRGVTSTVLATAGTYSSSYSQQYYKVTSSFPHDTGSYLYEWWPLTQVISPASLTTLGENPANNRVSVRAWTWNGCTISQAAIQSVDASPAATHWTAGANTTVTGAGPLSIVVSAAGTGSVTSTLLQAPAALQGTRWTGVDLSGYRYLQLALNHTAGTASAYTLTIGGKIWTHDRLGVALKTGSALIQIDLCAPDGVAGVTDATDTQWPYNAGFSTQSDGWAYGCHNVGSLLISRLQASQSFTLTSLTLLKLDHQTLTILPTYTGWVQAFPEVITGGGAVTTTTYYRRGQDGDTDGEGTDYVWVRVVSSGTITDTYTAVTIANAVNSFNGAGATFPSKGFAASIGVADPGLSGNLLRNDFLNGSLWCGYLGGAGLTYNGAWTSQIDAGLGTRNAQFLIESIDWYPTCGDLFNYAGGGYATNAQFAAGTILRGSSIGLVVQADSKPAVGISVNVKKTGASDTAGSATSDTFGQYRQSGNAGTGLNYGKGGTTYDTTASTRYTPHPVVTRAFYARYRHRASFYEQGVTSQDLNPTNFIDKAGRYHRAVSRDLNIYYWRSDFYWNVWAVNALQVTAASTDHYPSICQDVFGFIWLVFTSDNGTNTDGWRMRSDDDGFTWNTKVMAIPNGTKIMNCNGEDGSYLEAAVVASGTDFHLQAVYRGTGDLAFSSVYTLVDTTNNPLLVANDTFSITQGPSGPQLWLLHVVIAGETSSSDWYSADNALSWTRMT